MPFFCRGRGSGLRDSGARRIVSTNTVARATNEIDIAPLIVAALAQLTARQS